MAYPGHHAEERPDHLALVMAGSGETRTYRELNEQSNRLALAFYAAGLRPGDHVAIYMQNQPAYFEVLWAALRSGLYLVAINHYLTVDEAAYLLEDSGARALVVSAALADRAVPLAATAPGLVVRLAAGGPVEGFDDYEPVLAAHPPTPLGHEERGDIMQYSSGTTGRPKGIRRPYAGGAIDEPPPFVETLKTTFPIDGDTIYLCPAPLYHSAPLQFSWATQVVGGTVVCMERFDAAGALAAIERHRVTHSQWVPTMFIRLLKLPEDERSRYDISSLEIAIHAAAPCPREIKQQMLDWWGDIVCEYYGATEGVGLTFATAADWRARPGTVGRAKLGIIHICDDEGLELPAGEPGLVYFEQPQDLFKYHNDPERTKAVKHPEHPTWTAPGDIGYVDEDGFLYLTDRKAFMIISGGVNISPQEIEDCLVVHPKVTDVAVIGVPNPEMGEEVKAVVQPAPDVVADESLAEELLAYCRKHLAAYKVPRSIDFDPELPRLPTGKLYKRLLRDKYWQAAAGVQGSP